MTSRRRSGCAACCSAPTRIVFNRVASGHVFAAALETLGIANAVQKRVTRTAPMAIFTPVLEGRGDDIAAGTMTLLATTPGIRLLGPLPVRPAEPPGLPGGGDARHAAPGGGGALHCLSRLARRPSAAGGERRGTCLALPGELAVLQPAQQPHHRPQHEEVDHRAAMTIGVAL